MLAPPLSFALKKMNRHFKVFGQENIVFFVSQCPLLVMLGQK